MSWTWPETTIFTHEFLRAANRHDPTVTRVLVEHPNGWERAQIYGVPEGRERRAWFLRVVELSQK